MGGIKADFIKGVSWSFLAQFVNQAFSLVMTIILARLLSPAEFGIVAMVTVLTGFAKILVDFGFGNALIFKKDITEVDKSSVFWTNLALSVTIAAIYIIMAGFIARFYNQEQLKLITIILSSLFVLNSVSIVNSSILRKNLEFKTIFIVQLVAQVISGTMAIVLAVNNYSYWSIVVQMLVGSIVSTALGFYFVRWFPKMLFSRSALKELFMFSWALVGNNTLNYWVRNIDNLLIGKFMGPADLSLYTKAYSTLTLPIRNVSDVVSKVLFPSLSKLRDSPARIKSVYFKVCRTIMLMVAPIMVFVFVEADLLINLVFGPKWIGMLPIVRVFSILAINQSIGTLIFSLYMAQGKTKEMFYLGTVLRVILIGSIIIGLQWGTFGVAICYTITSYISSFIQHSYLGKISGFTVRSFMANMSLILAVNILIGGVIYLFRVLCLDSLGPYILLALSFLSYVLLYVLSLTLLREEAFLELKKSVTQHLKPAWRF